MLALWSLFVEKVGVATAIFVTSASTSQYDVMFYELLWTGTNDSACRRSFKKVLGFRQDRR